MVCNCTIFFVYMDIFCLSNFLICEYKTKKGCEKMKKKTYKLLRPIPIAGKIVEAICDPYLYIRCSPAIADGTLQDAIKLLKEYEESHYDEQLTRSLLYKLYRLRKEYLSDDNEKILERQIEQFRQSYPNYRLWKCYAFKDFFWVSAIHKRFDNVEDVGGLCDVPSTEFYFDKHKGTIDMCNSFIDLKLMKEIREINFEVNLNNYLTEDEKQLGEKWKEKIREKEEESLNEKERNKNK